MPLAVVVGEVLIEGGTFVDGSFHSSRADTWPVVGEAVADELQAGRQGQSHKR